GIAARLHDIGKLSIPDNILKKPGKLDAAEYTLMKTHTTVGAELLSGSSVPEVIMAERIARHHHEWWNGAGYPAGLKGTAIPVAARVTALADVWDALTHVRPYKAAWPREAALAHIESLSGVQFDPVLTKIFGQLIRDAERDWDAFHAHMEDDARASPLVQAQELTAALQAGG
ncbi:MAG: HD domain-containing protein, partial [Betaproteobacteria bacterium]|nr:HD domain-containing protein [Betaproteobacteria bacterium]